MNTVAEMREVAKRMNLSGTSKLRKSELYAAILAGIESAHGEAIDENRKRVVSKIVTGYRSSVHPVASLTNRAQILAGKINAYMRQNGTDKLTPAQWRRVRKAMAKHAVTHIDMGPFYVIP